jgi:hypothetical protein
MGGTPVYVTGTIPSETVEESEDASAGRHATISNHEVYRSTRRKQRRAFTFGHFLCFLCYLL